MHFSGSEAGRTLQGSTCITRIVRTWAALLFILAASVAGDEPRGTPAEAKAMAARAIAACDARDEAAFAATAPTGRES